MTDRTPTPTGWSDTDWIKKLQDDEENPLACLHINQGSFDAAADAYEEEYKRSKRTALEIADQVDAYVVRTSIGAEAAAMLRKQHADIGRLNAERETIISDFLKRTGQYVTNDASRDAAIAAAVAAEREEHAAELKCLTAERDCAIGMLVDWVVAIRDSDASWDSWDDQYKDAWYRPCLIRDLIDAKLPPEEEDNG